MQPHEIDITNLDRAEMVAALYNNTTTGMFGAPAVLMTKEDAQEAIAEILAIDGRRPYIDYLRFRCMKIHFGKDLLDTRLYDRDNGYGAAAAALAPLLASQPTSP